MHLMHMDVNYRVVKNNMKADLLDEKNENMPIAAFLKMIKERSDRLMNYFLLSFFIIGIALGYFYDTYLIALGVGGACLLAYYSAKILFPESTLYQFIASANLGIFTAQLIYQMHGLFEMHFIAFIGSAILITYQNWKLQLPLAVVIIIHHSIFGYLQFSGVPHVYFSQQEFMDVQTFIIHVFLALTIFFICGLWAYQFKKHSEQHIEMSFEIGRLQIAEQQKEQLLKVNSELDKFVYSVSHDLRAPLRSLMGIVEITADQTEELPVINHLQMMKESIARMDGFILDILDYSRNARSEFKKEEIDFPELLTEVIHHVKYAGSTNDPSEIKIFVEGKNTFISDRSRITIIMNNLISNAIRYQNTALNNQFVKINVVLSKKDATICVSDNGIGIPKELQNKIFDMFYRVNGNSVGSGLGLYIVKEAVEKLKGTIKVNSKPGEGSEFLVNIPNVEII